VQSSQKECVIGAVQCEKGECCWNRSFGVALKVSAIHHEQDVHEEQQWPSPAGGAMVPVPPFKLCAPMSCLAPRATSKL